MAWTSGLKQMPVSFTRWWAEHISRGVLMMNRGRPSEAEREFQRAIRFMPEDPVAYYNLGWVQLHLLNRYRIAAASLWSHLSAEYAAVPCRAATRSGRWLSEPADGAL